MDRSRVLFVMVLLLLPIGGLQARLVQLQLVDPDSYILTSNRTRQTVEIQRPPRGTIYDRKRRVLAEDQRSFDCYLILEEYEKAPGPLASLLGLPPDELQEKVLEIYEKIEKQVRQRPPAEQGRLYRRERRAPYLLKKGISFEAAVAIETSPELYGGALVRETLKRVYPYGPSACHLVGYLGRVTGNEKEFLGLLQDAYFFQGFEEKIGQDGIAQLYRRGDFHEEMIGRAGVERTYDRELRGKSGLCIIEREAGTSNRKVIELLPSEPGADLELTIDIEEQKAAEEALGPGLPAAAVVLDARTGATLVLASNRLYNPNDFIPPGNPAAVRRVLDDLDGKPLQSRALASYPQGSVFKIITAVAALEEKKVGPDDPLPCRGRFDERLQRGFACWIWNNFKGMHGEVPLHEALEKSCNCYFYECGKRLGMDALLKWSRAMGYGARLEIDVPGEAGGRLPERARWENDVLSLSIGQHELMASPLQAAVLTALIGNGGLRVKPHLRRGEPPPPTTVPLSPATLAAVRRGLHDVVHSEHGTAHKTELRKYRAAGKTSTAQAPTREHPERCHAWFAGYAPEENPRFAVAVFIEGGGHGGETAAPIAAKILERLFQEK